jgi:hypothetical protein
MYVIYIEKCLLFHINMEEEYLFYIYFKGLLWNK